MNERIRELAEEAGMILGDAGEFDMAKFMPKEVKFAQLIVKECARVFESEVDTWKQMDPYQGSIKRKGTKAIKEHFGVEE